MRVLVLGATGMLGHKLVQQLQVPHEVVATVRSERLAAKQLRALGASSLLYDVDATNLERISTILSEVRPEWVINCIGVIKQLPTASDAVTSIRINSLFPHQLAALCYRTDARLMHISTDCVFSGRKGRYFEDDIPDPVDLYGRSKLLGEIHGENNLTIRTSIIGRELETSVGLVEWFLKNDGKQVNGYRKAIYSGLTTLELAALIDRIMTRHSDMRGLFQVASQAINKYELLLLLQEAFGTHAMIQPVDEPMIDRSLDGSRFTNLTGWTAPNWRAMVQGMAFDEPL